MLEEISYCNFIVPARSDAAYIHCIRVPNNGLKFSSYTYIHEECPMGYKTISLSEEAYEVLRKSKRENESFSQVVIRLAQKRTLRDFVDCISDDSVVKLSKALEDFRKERSELWAQSMEELVS